MDDPIQMPYVNYGRLVIGVEQAVYAFMNEHPEFELNRYGDILEENGLKWGAQAMSSTDATALDGQAVMALLMGAIRTDRFCEGALLGFFEDGSVRRWLARLAILDLQMAD